jgi:hypothetical protein
LLHPPSKGTAMTLQIPLAPDEEARLRERAAAAGKDVQTFAREVLIETIDRPTLAELLAPVHAETRRLGTPVEEVDAMLDRARDEARRDRKAGQPPATP